MDDRQLWFEAWMFGGSVATIWFLWAITKLLKAIWEELNNIRAILSRSERR